MKKVAIVQSNYIPWKGYFDLIASVDEFIVFDEMQYTRRDWRNRNRIKTPNGVQWLTVPVQVKGKYLQRISETRINDPEWARAHWRTLRQFYANASHFSDYADRFEELYRGTRHEYLSKVNVTFIRAICEILGIRTVIKDCTEYQLIDGKSERLASLCTQAGGTEYVCGPSTREYMDTTVFEQAGLTLTWFDYSGYPEYPQLWGDFEHSVTILDLLFNCGGEAHKYMKFVGGSRTV